MFSFETTGMKNKKEYEGSVLSYSSFLSCDTAGRASAHENSLGSGYVVRFWMACEFVNASREVAKSQSSMMQEPVRAGYSNYIRISGEEVALEKDRRSCARVSGFGLIAWNKRQTAIASRRTAGLGLVEALFSRLASHKWYEKTKSVKDHFILS